MGFFIYNDTMYNEGELVISPDSRAFKYGEGLFETMKYVNGKIQLQRYHFERLFSGMKILNFTVPESFKESFLKNQINKLCERNSDQNTARVRLTVFRNDLKNYSPGYIIQSWPVEENNELNSDGLVIDIFPDVKKSCDVFSNIKSNNYLQYLMAADHAKNINADDCILLNMYGRICETSIANIFIIKDKIIYTPPLSEGCIAGVMRRFIIHDLQTNFKVEEKFLTIEDMLNADEVFITNSIKGVRWVKKFKAITYKNNIGKEIFNKLNQQLLQE